MVGHSHRCEWDPAIRSLRALGNAASAARPTPIDVLPPRGDDVSVLVLHYGQDHSPAADALLEIAAIEVALGVVALDRLVERALRENLAHAAIHDPLTGLPNRVLFMDRLEHALKVDDPLSLYLPYFPRASEITLRQIGGPGCWMGLGRSSGTRRLKYFPSYTSGVSRQARSSTSIASAIRSRLSSLRRP